jgi:hypothetical protein
MIKYTRTGNGLVEYFPQVPFVDTDQVSKNYFRVSGFPDKLYVGKNSFRISGNNDTLVIGSRIYIDVVDSNGNIIYHEVLNIANRDKSKMVVIHIYPDTPLGSATVYIAGRVQRDPRTQDRIPYVDDPFSPNDKSRPNIMWIGKTVVVQGQRNSSEIYFASEPKISFSEKLVSYNSVTGSSRLVELSGSGAITLSQKSRVVPSQYGNKSVFDDAIVEGGKRVQGFPTITNNVGEYSGDVVVPEYFKLSRITSTAPLFNKSMEGGIITVSGITVGEFTPKDLTVLKPIPDYSASIVEVVNNTTIEVDTPFSTVQEYTNVDGVSREIIFDSFINQPTYSISYYNEDVDVSVTDSSESFAVIEFRDLEPVSGKVDRIKVSYKPVGSYGEFVQLGEFPIREQNYLVDDSVQVMTRNDGLREKRLGYPKSTDDVNMYWSSSGVGVSGTSIDQSDENISNAISITHDGITAGTKYVVVEPVFNSNSRITSSTNTEYKLRFKSHYGGDSAGTGSWSPPYLEIYISGSGIKSDTKRGGGNGDILSDLSLGTYIGTVDSKFGRTQDNEFYFITTDRGNISPKFVVRSGVWDIGQIEILPRQDFGFSPNQAKLTIPLVDLRDRAELAMDFKYMNVDGRPANIDSRVYGVYFEKAAGGVPQSVLDDITQLKTDVSNISGSVDELLSKTLISGSAQIADEISGSFDSVSGSIATDIVEVSGSLSELRTKYYFIPEPPTNLSLTQLSDSNVVNIQFTGSISKGIDRYEIYNSDDNSDFSLIGIVNSASIQENTSSFYDLLDVTLDDQSSGSVYYKVYAYNNSNQSQPLTGSLVLTAPDLAVSDVTVTADNNVFILTYNIPDDRRVKNVKIYVDSNDVEASVTQSSAALVYTGKNTLFSYEVPSVDRTKYHQFYIDVEV